MRGFSPMGMLRGRQGLPGLGGFEPLTFPAQVRGREDEGWSSTERTTYEHRAPEGVPAPEDRYQDIRYRPPRPNPCMPRPAHA